MDVVGFEPTTFGLRDRYSNQLSYTSIYECRETRTLDLRVKSPLLCHLSYTPMITVVGFEPTILTVMPSIQWMLASLAIQGLVLLRRTHPHFVRTLDYFVIESWYEDPALTNWATLQVQTKGLEPLTVGLEIRCANPLRHVCIKVGMMGIEPIFTLLGPTAYKAVALTCWATSQPLREDSNLQPSHCANHA